MFVASTTMIKKDKYKFSEAGKSKSKNFLWRSIYYSDLHSQYRQMFLISHLRFIYLDSALFRKYTDIENFLSDEVFLFYNKVFAKLLRLSFINVIVFLMLNKLDILYMF